MATTPTDRLLRPGQPGGLTVIVTVAALTVIAIALFFVLSGDDTPEAVPEAAIEGEQRPTGAGTKPDGVADEAAEGLDNQTSTEDFIDNSAASGADVTPADPDPGREAPATDATGLVPADGDADQLETLVPQ